MPLKKQIKGKDTSTPPDANSLWLNRILAAFSSTVAPLLLIYLNLRCEKNQCVLYQLPLVIPNYPGAYLSFTAATFFFGFVGMMFIFKVTTARESGTTSGFYSLLAASLLLLGLASVKPEFIHTARNECMRILVVATLFSYAICAVLATTSWLNIGVEKIAPRSWLCAFFMGTHRSLNIGPVELKYFFYVNVGLVALGLLDLLLFLDFALRITLTAPLIFLTVTQYIFVAHKLFYENFMATKPFIETEKLGFYWLLKTMLYLPFLYSLPVHYAAATEIVIPKSLMLADCVLFLFGFIVYASSIHQKENFVQDQSTYKNYKSIPVGGKRLLIGGYWGIVQKPDYLGFMMMWLSWIVACGLSGLSLVVLVIVYGSVIGWLSKVSKLNKNKYGAGWIRYTNMVPQKVIPFVY